ncbi:hypothetical protein [Ornithinicoccus halotolerans]|uniref:hypothetical protein n=1 Tax=Ornithinicoccus halotolerans TaxID=1748220 RepID=UPI00129676DD|nr:hypothetical protein [Ornithinicoccus halotolerans]
MNTTGRRLLAASCLAGLAVVGAAGTAMADHTHVLLLGNGQCAVLSQHGGEKYVQLPHADEFAANRQHPLHVNVHLGEPGQRPDGRHVIFVKGSADDLANCDGYVND